LFITNLILSCGEATSQAFYIILTPIFLKLRGLLRWTWSMGFASLQRPSGPFAKALREHSEDSFQIEAVTMLIWAENHGMTWPDGSHVRLTDMPRQLHF
jgi:hypothetical protein